MYKFILLKLLILKVLTHSLTNSLTQSLTCLLIGANSSGLSDPFVIAEVFGLKQKTQYFKEVNAAFFNETFYFNVKDMKKDQIAEAQLKLTVYDHNWFRSHELIGIYQVDLLTIYNNSDHEMYRKWAAIRNPLDENESGSQGLLKFSAVCLGPGNTHSLTYSLTYSLIHLIIYSLR